MQKLKYLRLITKQLNGEISPAEEAELTAWLKRHPLNALAYQQQKAIWDKFRLMAQA
ncbi:FecR/PupR family sigma factor regulator [Hugenholtzia roseola]|uniref:FecR/PupR family sigma factor regulator n=1 Tax=Hugenholtzia roseola TaxID=1002 RepID=UPI00041947F2|nr:DUF4880 domain-containing protein [Hugenholtzia roseola]